MAAGTGYVFALGDIPRYDPLGEFEDGLGSDMETE
jgi:hypothetical protein